MKKTLDECLKEIRENAPPTERIVIEEYPAIAPDRPLITDSFNPTPEQVKEMDERALAYLANNIDNFKGRIVSASIGCNDIGIDHETGRMFQETSTREFIDGRWVETSRERRGG